MITVRVTAAVFNEIVTEVTTLSTSLNQFAIYAMTREIARNQEERWVKQQLATTGTQGAECQSN